MRYEDLANPKWKGRVVVISDFQNTGGQDPEVAKNVKFFSTISLSLLNVTIIDRCIRSLSDSIFELIPLSLYRK